MSHLSCRDCKFRCRDTCRKLPPVVVVGAQHSGHKISTVFPKVDEYDWCGDHISRRQLSDTEKSAHKFTQQMMSVRGVRAPLHWDDYAKHEKEEILKTYQKHLTRTKS